MNTAKKIRAADYDYALPRHRIARYPLEERSASKLLVYRGGRISQELFGQIADHLPEGALLMANNSRVIPARLPFRKQTGAHLEIFCLEPHQPADYENALQGESGLSWKCLVGNLKKWKEGQLLYADFLYNGEKQQATAELVERGSEHQIIRFSWDAPGLRFADLTEALGSTPIPPYLDRESEAIDRQRYQTVYSKTKGSVAAPTAGLHFTDTLLRELAAKNISQSYLTLHVGASTFRPVEAGNAAGHAMHTEHFSISKQVLENILAHDCRVICVGTTTTRTLESLHHLGARLISNGTLDEHLGQWDAYRTPSEISAKESYEAMHRHMQASGQEHLHGATSLMIVPGYRFRMARALITNFHMPRSTLLMLIAAYVGEEWRDIYEYALANDFRFLSYGDSSLLFPR